MSKRWLMLLLSSFFAVGMFLSYEYVNVYAAPEETTSEVSSEDIILEDASGELIGDESSEVVSEAESPEEDPSLEEESSSDAIQELESLTDKKNYDKEEAASRYETLKESVSEGEDESVSSSSSGGSTVIVQEQDDSAVRTLINEFIKGRDTLNGFQKQVLNRLDAISFCSIVIVAVTICNFFIRK